MKAKRLLLSVTITAIAILYTYGLFMLSSSLLRSIWLVSLKSAQVTEGLEALL